jgi:hypothetical protein
VPVPARIRQTPDTPEMQRLPSPSKPHLYKCVLWPVKIKSGARRKRPWFNIPGLYIHAGNPQYTGEIHAGIILNRTNYQARTMKPPRIPPMLSTIVQTGLTAVDGVCFNELDTCPVCGGPVSGYDTRKKTFALIRDENGERTITVTVKRFYCRTCDRIYNAHEPFYPGTRIGSPVIDLCLTLAATMPANRTAAYLDVMGVIVDRTSCRLYIKNHSREVPANDLFGIMMPTSVISLSTVAARASGQTPVKGADVLSACGFPSADRAALILPAAKKHKERNTKESKERSVQESGHDRDAR